MATGNRHRYATAMVRLAAMQSIGGVENSITDGAWEDPIPDRETLVDMAVDDCYAEEPSACMAIGEAKVKAICEKYADTFEYREW